jgi:hypothetical protein
MKRPANRLRPVRRVFTGLFVGAVICAAGEARGQTQSPAQGGSKASAKGQSDRPSGSGNSGRRSADRKKPSTGEPSAAYQESLRQTVERRRQRKARRQQNAGDAAGAVGAIVPWPMPPALIIRHTREVHGEVDSLMYGLRR